MKYLSTSQQRWTARGLSGLGLSLMLGGGVMAYQNPQFQQAEQLRAVHKYGSLQQAVMIPQDGMMGRGLGLGLFVAGLATSGLGLWLSLTQNPVALPRNRSSERLYRAARR
jgi:hypothetical protein